ncbi:MAG: hypothetical protein EVA65_15780 [Oceanococcus sp.]|nr:MAG: hypothetical protein EVA65_15780 [Oceanococcus sp.]
MKNVKTVLGTVIATARLPSSANGNPRYEVTIKALNGDTVRAATKPDCTLGYEIDNPEFRRDVHAFEIGDHYRRQCIARVEVAALERTDRKALSWPDLWQHGLAKRDNGGRWYPAHPTTEAYIDQGGYRSPSRAYPNSYASPLLTLKFAKWLCENDRVLAARLGFLAVPREAQQEAA